MMVRQLLKRIGKRGLVLAVVVLMLSSLCLSASASTFVPYTTYTYDYYGDTLESPHAYVAAECRTAKDMGLNGELSSPADLFVDSNGYIYIADTGNNRIVFLDPSLKYLGELSNFYNTEAIVPTIQARLEEETAAYEQQITRFNKKYAKAEENPATYDLTVEELQNIEQRVAAKPTAEEREAEYAAVVAEFAGRTMPDYLRIQEFFEGIMPIRYTMDCLTEQEITNWAEFGDTPEERRLSAYYFLNVMGTAADPSADALTAPEGVFVTEDGTLYVADTGGKRVAQFTHNAEDGWSSSAFKVVGDFKKPTSSILTDAFEFQPQNLVVDSAGRIYVNVKNVNSGIMQLSAKGEFMGFFGAQKVTSTLFDWFVRLFQTEAQRAKAVRIVPRVYNNIAIDSKNFIWITANSMEDYDLVSYLNSGDSGTAPIKRLNPSGSDVLVRNAEFAPGGDIPTDTQDVSSIVDVAVKGDTGIYTLVDNKRQKLFTYDSEGNLLYAFGGSGSSLGVFTTIGAAAYQDTDLLVLDVSTGYVTRFQQTAYASAIETALTADSERNYDLSEQSWQQVHKLNANFDLAYVGLAKCYLHSAAKADDATAKDLYKTAMEYYKLARNTTGYSKAFKEYRSLYVRDHVLLVLAVPIAIIVGLYFAIRAIKKVNARMHVTGTPTTLTEELCFGWRAIFHPISGFWEIKREKRGSMRAAVIFLVLATLSFCYQATGTAYLFTTVSAEYVSILQQAANVLLPVILWVLASWSFTTLMSGEGSMKDIFIALCYGLIPLILILVPNTLLSNVFSLEEEAFLTFFRSLAYGWMVLLIIFGSMVIQDYTFGKNLVTVLLSIFGMAAILFIVLLLISLTGKMWGFFTTIYREIVYRL